MPVKPAAALDRIALLIVTGQKGYGDL